MSRITQADVVRGAIQQLSKRGGYTIDTYFAQNGQPTVGPGEHVGSTCAVGGVEQSIWRLTGEAVADDTNRWLLAMTEAPLSGNETPRQKLYAGVMRKLNAKARKLFPELGGEEISNVEQVTFEGTKATSRRRTLQVFEAVLADLEAKASA